jgi:hypothetical protein
LTPASENGAKDGGMSSVSRVWITLIPSALRYSPTQAGNGLRIALTSHHQL